MGCAGSRFDQVPVTGHPTGLVVLPESREKYLSSQPLVLKLREKFFSFSGDDCSIKVLELWVHNISYTITTYKKQRT